MKTKELIKEDVFEFPNDPYCGLGGTPLMKRIKIKKFKSWSLQRRARRTLER